MEEPEKPSHGGDHRPSSKSLPQSPSISHQGNSTQSLSDQSHFASSTYIVQVPRDQVYLVPPPENAIRVDNHRRDQHNSRNPSRHSSCSFHSLIFAIIIFLIIIGTIVGIFLAIFFTYRNPSFSIEHFLAKNKTCVHHKQSLEYDIDIRMKVHNPNKYHSISYYQDNSNVNLSSKQKEIASGNFPKFDQGSKKSRIVHVTMHGSGSQLPKAIATSMNGTHSKGRISLTLSMNVPVKLKIGTLKVKSKKIVVSCSFLVDRFTKDARVVTQECTTGG